MIMIPLRRRKRDGARWKKGEPASECMFKRIKQSIIIFPQYLFFFLLLFLVSCWYVHREPSIIAILEMKIFGLHKKIPYQVAESWSNHLRGNWIASHFSPGKWFRPISSCDPIPSIPICFVHWNNFSFFSTWIISIRSFSLRSSEGPGWWERSTGHCTTSNRTARNSIKKRDRPRRKSEIFSNWEIFLRFD